MIKKNVHREASDVYEKKLMFVIAVYDSTDLLQIEKNMLHGIRNQN